MLQFPEIDPVLLHLGPPAGALVWSDVCPRLSPSV
jgi:hypothetical protein